MDTTESRSFAARLADLLKNEQHAMADFLVALAEFDRQRAWVALGYSGLFPFLHQKLGLSKSASFFRKTAAELIQRYPEIVEPLRDGRLCLSTMASVAKVLTPANRAEVLPRFFHRSALEDHRRGARSGAEPAHPDRGDRHPGPHPAARSRPDGCDRWRARFGWRTRTGPVHEGTRRAADSPALSLAARRAAHLHRDADPRQRVPASTRGARGDAARSRRGFSAGCTVPPHGSELRSNRVAEPRPLVRGRHPSPFLDAKNRPCPGLRGAARSRQPDSTAGPLASPPASRCPPGPLPSPPP